MPGQTSSKRCSGPPLGGPEKRRRSEPRVAVEGVSVSGGAPVLRIPDELLLFVLGHLTNSVQDLQACELACQRWRGVCSSMWRIACDAARIAPAKRCTSSDKRTFQSSRHHHQWRRGLWGHALNSLVNFDMSDYVLYDAAPFVAPFSDGTLVPMQIESISGFDERREAFIATHLARTSQLPSNWSVPCTHDIQGRVIKLELCPDGSTYAVTTTGIDLYECRTEGGRGAPPRSLDTTGVPTSNVAVLHASGSKAYALTKQPAGVQVWDSATGKQEGHIPFPGTFEWPSEPYHTWRSQEKFCFRDTTCYGVVVDDEGIAWAVHMPTRRVCRIPCEDASARGEFGAAAPNWKAGEPNGAVPFPNPRGSGQAEAALPHVPHHATPAFAMGLEAHTWDDVDELLLNYDPATSRFDDLALVPRNVRVSGSCVLLWGGRADTTGEAAHAERGPRGRAFVQLWRSESSVNTSTSSNDLVCVLQAKYDHILLAHTDEQRVYVLFHPFCIEGGHDGGNYHLQQLVLDVWDAHDGSFVCRRVMHNEDRSPNFLHGDRLHPGMLQILHAGDDEFVYYTSQRRGGRNFIAVYQFCTMGSTRDATAAPHATREWWQEYDPERLPIAPPPPPAPKPACHADHTPPARTHTDASATPHPREGGVAEPAPEPTPEVDETPRCTCQRRSRKVWTVSIGVHAPPATAEEGTPLLRTDVREELVSDNMLFHEDASGDDALLFDSSLNTGGCLRLRIVEAKGSPPAGTAILPDPTPLDIVQRLCGAGTSHQALHEPPCRPDIAQLFRSSDRQEGLFAGHAAMAGPIVTTQVSRYFSRKGHALQEAAGAVQHYCASVDDILSSVADRHSGAWREHIPALTAGAPQLSPLGALLKEQILAALLNVATGIHDADPRESFLSLKP